MTFTFTTDMTLITRSPGGTDGYGNDVLTETTATVKGVFVPGGSTEIVQGQDLVISQPAVYLPAGTVVTPIDVIEVAGHRYDVDGSPNEWTSPFTGWQPAVEVKLKQVTG